MKQKSLAFLLKLLLVLLVVFCIHISILWYNDMSLFGDRILWSYLLNYALAVLLLMVIGSSLNKQKDYTGFIFMAGSAIKFLIFFLFFYPLYQSDGIMQTAEFAAFFTPYAVCLTLEVVYLSKLLNNQTYSEDTPPEKKK